MSESKSALEELFRLIIRYANGEQSQYFTKQHINPDSITNETRFAVVSTVLLENTAEVTDVTVFNIKDVTYIRSEKVTLDKLAGEQRSVGIRSTARTGSASDASRSLSENRFV